VFDFLDLTQEVEVEPVRNATASHSPNENGPAAGRAVLKNVR